LSFPYSSEIIGFFRSTHHSPSTTYLNVYVPGGSPHSWMRQVFLHTAGYGVAWQAAGRTCDLPPTPLLATACACRPASSVQRVASSLRHRDTAGLPHTVVRHNSIEARRVPESVASRRQVELVGTPNVRAVAGLYSIVRSFFVPSRLETLSLLRAYVSLQDTEARRPGTIAAFTGGVASGGIPPTKFRLGATLARLRVARSTLAREI